ncbi:hypothetical protein KCU90_g149, partial [Aureobasidium melanogenum]
MHPQHGHGFLPRPGPKPLAPETVMIHGSPHLADLGLGPLLASGSRTWATVAHTCSRCIFGDFGTCQRLASTKLRAFPLIFEIPCFQPKHERITEVHRVSQADSPTSKAKAAIAKPAAVSNVGMKWLEVYFHLFCSAAVALTSSERADTHVARLGRRLGARDQNSQRGEIRYAICPQMVFPPRS